MKLVDSHCHIDCIDLSISHNNDIHQLMAEAERSGVVHMLCVSITLEALPRIKQIARRFPDKVSYSVGVHPNEHPGQTIDESLLEQEANLKECVAIGETGLDYYRCEGDMSWQQERFRIHIRLAKALQKPLIIHTRNASDDTLRILEEERADACVMHCFAEDWRVAKKALDMGYYISLAGIVTFKNAHALKEVAKKVPMDRLLVETDSPYLAPTPFRGKQNHPALVKYTAEYIASLRGQTKESIAEHTTENFKRLFPLASVYLSR